MPDQLNEHVPPPEVKREEAYQYAPLLWCTPWKDAVYHALVEQECP